MKSFLSTLVMVICSLTINAQNSSDYHFCNYVYGADNSAYELCKTIQMSSFATNIEADKAIEKLLRPLGLKKNFILVPCDHINNCAAVTLNDGYRYIIYDKNFMAAIENNSASNWSSISILAHELGHHLNGHTLSKSSLEDQREEELEADEFSGFILQKLGATLKDAQAAMRSLPHPSESLEKFSDHPCLTKRLAAIARGFDQALGTTTTATTTPESIDYPSEHTSNSGGRFEDPIDYLSFSVDHKNSWVTSTGASAFEYDVFLQNNSKYQIRLTVKLPYGYYDNCIAKEQNFRRQGYRKKVLTLNPYESKVVQYDFELNGARCVGISDALITECQYLE